MGSSEKPRWSLVLEVAAEPAQTFVVRGAEDASAVMLAIRETIHALMKRGGCRSLVIGVHVEGAACDHQVRAG